MQKKNSPLTNGKNNESMMWSWFAFLSAFLLVCFKESYVHDLWMTTDLGSSFSSLHPRKFCH